MGLLRTSGTVRSFSQRAFPNALAYSASLDSTCSRSNHVRCIRLLVCPCTFHGFECVVTFACRYAHLLPALPRDSTELQESVTRASREANELSSDGEAVSSQHNLYFWRCGTHRSHSWLAIANCYELSLEDITRLKNNSLGSDVSLLCAESFDILSRWYQARIRAIDSATGLLGASFCVKHSLWRR